MTWRLMKPSDWAMVVGIHTGSRLAFAAARALRWVRL